MALLVDSSVLIDLERRGQRLGDIFSAAPGESLALASIVASELLRGIYRADSPTRQARRREFVELALVGHLP